jgi:hypothetical protein
MDGWVGVFVVFVWITEMIGRGVVVVRRRQFEILDGVILHM